MVFFVVGVLLGAVSILFILQNSMVITVSFLSWTVTGSLSLVLLVAVLTGVIINLLVLLPNLIKDDLRLADLRSEKRDLERELEIQIAEKQRLEEQIAATPTTLVL